MSQRKASKTAGTGLLETLLTLVILMLLAAMLIPVYSTNGRSSKRTVCLSHLKQSALGLIMYSNDWDDRAPIANRWMDATFPYVKDQALFCCPLLIDHQIDHYGFAMRSTLGGKNIVKLKSPYKEPLVFDSLLLDRNANTNLVFVSNFTRHPKQNVAYADGHAKAAPSPTYR